MKRSLLLLCCACATTPEVRHEIPAEAAILEVEDALREAEVAVDARDGAKARPMLAAIEARIRNELGSAPDRHQLAAHAAELRDRLAGRRKPVEAPAPIEAPAVEAPEVEAPEVEAPEVLASAPALIEDLDDDKPTEDPVTAFREGPLRDRGKALRMIGTAKRAKKKPVSRRLYAEARALLESCASEGGRMVESAPDLQLASFKVGKRKRSADQIVGECKSKAKKLKKKRRV